MTSFSAQIESAAFSAIDGYSTSEMSASAQQQGQGEPA